MNCKVVQKLMFTSGTGPRIDESKKLAQLVQNNLLANLGSKNRNVKSADFAVVRQTYMASNFS